MAVLHTRAPSTHPLEEIFHPRSIAVVGASADPRSQGYSYMKALVDLGYRGKIYAVNPKYAEILGRPSYSSLSAIPEPVDYVISNLPAPYVPAMLEEAGQKRVKAVHLYTARFSETGRQEAIQLEQEVLRIVRKHGFRLIGPNCMGLYYPAEGISFWGGMSRQSGPVGLISQSGQMVGEITRAASQRGALFSKAISYGNALDLNEGDFLQYLSRDEETRAILMYVEGLREGRRFLRILRDTTPRKPVIILKGGRGESGARATASHTASLAGSSELWKTALVQAGAISAANLGELADLAVAFRFLPALRGRRVGVIGGAGGASVLAADECEEAGLDVVPLSDRFRAEIREKGISVWDWIGNPADMSIRENRNFSMADMLETMARSDEFDLLITMMHEPHGHWGGPVSLEDHLKQYRLDLRSTKPLLGVLAHPTPDLEDHGETRWQPACEMRQRLVEAEIPFFPTIGRAARAARKLVDYYRRNAPPSP